MDVFTEENRNRYLNETTESLNALLNDAFLEDQNHPRCVLYELEGQQHQRNRLLYR